MQIVTPSLKRFVRRQADTKSLVFCYRKKAVANYKTRILTKCFPSGNGTQNRWELSFVQKCRLGQAKNKDKSLL